MTSGPDDNAGYGYFFWIMRDENVADAYGMYGQHIYIHKKLQAVVTTTAHLACEEMRQRSYEAIKKHVFSQMT